MQFEVLEYPQLKALLRFRNWKLSAQPAGKRGRIVGAEAPTP
jgi:hypothetical protein